MIFRVLLFPITIAAIVEKAKIPVYAVDSNGIIPMSKFEKEELRRIYDSPEDQ